ncbi:MAG TPA: Fur family transcriptional regulator [Chitinophagales bacterium]|nr:Fur family transcriptional regulator [Chitinophagales bacterium]
MTITDIQQQLSEKGLKVTPQRIAVLEAIIKLNNHPSAENIIDYIRKNYPNISTATVYKVLDALVDNELIKRVKTDKDVMRYDAILHAHHHLYCTKTDKIKDYFNDDLNHLLANYFKKHRILDFEIADIKLQIVGKFTSPKKNALKKRNSLPK